MLAAFLALSACSAAIGGADYGMQYDYSEFFAATDGKTFRVETAGNAFPAMSEQEMRRRLLPVMQANRPRPRLTFTYERPKEPPRPDYHMVLIFNAAKDLGAARVCAGEKRLAEGKAGQVHVFAVYCRSEQVMSQTTAWTDAQLPEDPKVGQMFAQLFLVLFTELPVHRWDRGPFGFQR